MDPFYHSFTVHCLFSIPIVLRSMDSPILIIRPAKVTRAAGRPRATLVSFGEGVSSGPTVAHLWLHLHLPPV